MKSGEQLEAELAAWKAGPWILKHEHEAMVNRLKDQLTKALEAVVAARIHETSNQRKGAA